MRSEVWIFVLLFGVNITSGLNMGIERTEAKRVPVDNQKKEIRAYIRSQDYIDLTDFLTYYNIKTFRPMRRMLPVLEWAKLKNALRMPFLGGPCNCLNLKCECCNDFQIHGLNKFTCIDLLYNPKKRTVNMKVRVAHDIVIYDEIFEAGEAKTICMPLPVPYMEKGLIDICVGFYNVTVVNQKLRMCMALKSRINKHPALVLFFDCMTMGEHEPHVEGHGGLPIPFFDQFPSTFPPYTNAEDGGNSEPSADITDNDSNDSDDT